MAASAAGRRGARRSASSRSSIRVRQRSSAAAAESCGGAAAAAARDCAACSMSRPRVRRPNAEPNRSNRRQPGCSAASGEARSRSRSDEGGQPVKLDVEVQCVRPVVPFRAMHRFERPKRDPRHAHRIGNDNAVHRLAEQHPAASDRGDDRGRIAARIDQFDAGRRGRLHPGATLRAFEMRHEGDRIAATDAAPAGLGQQHGRIAQAIGGGKSKLTCGAGATNPVDHPARIQHGQRRVAAIAGAGDQLHRVPRVPCVEHRSDAEKHLGRVVIEQSRQQTRPEQWVQFIPEIPRFASPVIEEHAATGRGRVAPQPIQPVFRVSGRRGPSPLVPAPSRGCGTTGHDGAWRCRRRCPCA